MHCNKPAKCTYKHVTQSNNVANPMQFAHGNNTSTIRQFYGFTYKGKNCSAQKIVKIVINEVDCDSLDMLEVMMTLTG